MRDADAARTALRNDEQALTSVGAAGAEIAFDDFGTGDASPSRRRRSPLATLAIDRSFVSDLLTDASDAASTHAIVRSRLA